MRYELRWFPDSDEPVEPALVTHEVTRCGTGEEVVVHVERARDAFKDIARNPECAQLMLDAVLKHHRLVVDEDSGFVLLVDERA